MYILDPTLGSGRGRSMPWVGLLKYKEDSKAEEGIAGVVLINYEAAIVNAREVASIHKSQLSEAAKVMFLRVDNSEWYCDVKDIILHPEFDKDTLNSIALLMLNCDTNLRGKAAFEEKLLTKRGTWGHKYNTFDLDPNSANSIVEHLIWSSNMTEMQDIFAIGFTDSRKVLEQMAYGMETVNYTDCLDFYSREGLDYKWIVPTHYHCYRTVHHSDQCVFDSGMALVTNSSGKWTLIGISTWGPGCGLPSRFIDIEHYVPWIERHTSVLRRSWRNDSHKHYKDMWKHEDKPAKGMDVYTLERINDTEIVLRPLSWKEVIQGECWKKDGKLQYREEGKLKVSEAGLGVYGLSLYDLHFAKITCVSVQVACTARSITKFWVTKGFDEDDFPYDHIKTVPILLGRGTVPPRLKYVPEKWTKYYAIDVTHLMFSYNSEQNSQDAAIPQNTRAFVRMEEH